jgi:hypothetical protein
MKLQTNIATVLVESLILETNVNQRVQIVEKHLKKAIHALRNYDQVKGQKIETIS